MSDTIQNYTISRIITILENGNFEKFGFTDNSAYIYTHDYEIIIEASNHLISNKTVKFAIEVLKHLDECVSKAQSWLGHFNLKNDEFYPDALDKGYDINGIYIGKYKSGGVRRLIDYGFTITFSTKNYYPCGYTVKYHKNMTPFAVEEFVE